MDISVRSALTVVVMTTVLWAPPRPSRASVTVFGNGMAQACAQAAHQVADGVAADPRALDACDTAINTESLSLHDLAGTYINRGVLLLSRASYKVAKENFDTAIALMPELGEAYSDRGAALVGMRHYAEAIVEIDRGLALNATEPERAYFNRALADEGLDDLKSAYRDYSRAAELKPDWVQPRNELTRFTVAVRRPS